MIFYNRHPGKNGEWWTHGNPWFFIFFRRISPSAWDTAELAIARSTSYNNNTTNRYGVNRFFRLTPIYFTLPWQGDSQSCSNVRNAFS